MLMLLLIKYAERVKFNSLLLPHYYFTAINAFPRIKVKKVIKKGLEYHKTFAFSALHRGNTPVSGYYAQLYAGMFQFVNQS